MVHVPYMSLIKASKKPKLTTRPFVRRQIDSKSTLKVVSDLEKESSGTCYIPASIAREQLHRVVDDMQKMKQDHSLQLEDLNMRFHADKQNWKARSKEKRNLLRQNASSSMATFQDRLEDLQREYCRSEEIFKMRFELCLMHQEDLSHLYQRRLDESFRLLEVYKLQQEDIFMGLIKQSEKEIREQTDLNTKSFSLKHQQELMHTQALVDRLSDSVKALNVEISNIRIQHQRFVVTSKRERDNLHHEGTLNVAVRHTVSRIVNHIVDRSASQQSQRRENRLTIRYQNASQENFLYLSRVADLEKEIEILKHRISSMGRKIVSDTLDQMLNVILIKERETRLFPCACKASQTEQEARFCRVDAGTSCDFPSLDNSIQPVLAVDRPDERTRRSSCVDIATETVAVALTEKCTQTEVPWETSSRILRKLHGSSKEPQEEGLQLEKEISNIEQQIEMISAEMHQAEKKESSPKKSAQAKIFKNPESERHVLEEESQGKETARLILDGIEKGKGFWNSGDRVKCHQTYVDTLEQCANELRLNGAFSEAAKCEKVLEEASNLPPAKAALILREEMNDIVKMNKQETLSKAEAKLAQVPESQSKRSTKKQAPLSDSIGLGSNSATQMTKHKVESLEALLHADKIRIAQLETTIAALNQPPAQASPETLAKSDKNADKTLQNELQATRKEVGTLSKQLKDAYSHSGALANQITSFKAELAIVSPKASLLVKVQAELNAAQIVVAQASELSSDLTALRMLHTTLEASYREEQKLRKKYYNQVEDLKGKIRVFARCRPMSKSESERNCEVCVSFPNDMTISLQSSRGTKEFVFDQVFSADSTQEQVFEDTQHLIQSTIDGYNVCIFAYGQTGSGKTFTMTGNNALPGLSPRAIRHLFSRIAELDDQCTITLQAYMIELYNDTLIDLFALVDGHSSSDKLDIKKNEKGLVYVQNATIKVCTSAQQTLKLFEQANLKRQVGATKMNAESSRSHSVLSILVRATHKSTKVTTTGKISLVDLAGSERAGKTGATADRLKEAQAINKSLSALGDVIAALSSNEKFIPYRNNKDSLGGNAKTLMFVNVSPADYNQEETQTSLQYASRVKMITNTANKNADSERVNKLKTIIRQLRAGMTDIEYEGLID
uniref:Kinesinlike protein putative n=1 Tax=Albugo laibachii Nc14 TaxID=890382 RepID=F0WS78_9STRA|nr:kinesinlike protein putative [Albugo laibachii Nc14]|eukprot:CCA24196.1 kinesinlike protein putative [Albugo laibachii Nc14]